MAEKGRILLAEDDSSARSAFSQFLLGLGYEVREASNGPDALDLLSEGHFDLVLTDLKLPGTDGMEILRAIQPRSPQTLGILMTGYGTIQNAIQAMRLGVFEYLLKPVNFEELQLVLERAREYQRLHMENRQYRQEIQRRFSPQNLIGHSESMRSILDLIEKVADSDSTVLIFGESGTGKELVARAIHYRSNRMDKPLVPINCAAIPGDLLESELFGYEKGAFTGAHKTKVGRFELANGGTLFLDEVGEMSPQLQVKLLRVLQERSFERLGGIKSIEVDVRIIAATNKDLEASIQEGKFREDLYYRLSVIPIQIPPLRDRKEDIPLLAEYFLENFNRQKNREVKSITPRAMDALVQYGWPGNVRELENLMERLVVLKRTGVIDLEDLPEKLQGAGSQEELGRILLPEGGIQLDAAVHRLEKELILQALRRTGGVKKEAARLLGMKRTTLIQKMKRNNIVFGDQPSPSESTL
ncbi:MAG: sigma-54 dependent transcriptional regulator [bacterium]